MGRPEDAIFWWDRDVDRAGRPIRGDVRSAAHEVWGDACRQTQALLSDRAPAADLMEHSVAQVSRYLDRIGAPLVSRKHGLVMVAFGRALRRHAARMSRFELVGDSIELAVGTTNEGWIEQVNARLDLESIVRQLSERDREVLMLRAAEYEWKEIARQFGVSEAAVRNGFWREIERIRRRLQSFLRLTGPSRLSRFSRSSGGL